MASSPAIRLHRRLLVGHGWPWVLVWLVTRGWMLNRWSSDWSFIANDVRYYYEQLAQHGGYAVVLREYPLPVVWLLDALRLPVGGNEALYVVVFALGMASLDAWFSWWLWQHHSRVASIYWMAFVVALGPLVWFRYDLLAGVVVGAAVFLLARRPALSGALVALGAGIKLWPALLAAALLGRGRQARRRIVGFVGCGAVLAVLAVASGGAARLLSPLTWQQGRGLQIESVWATPLMWLHAFGGGGHGDPAIVVQMSAYNAYEVFDPRTSLLLRAASIAMGLGVVFAALVALLALRGGPVRPDVRALAMVAIVVVMIAANKTLSPQYVAWLGAVVAAWLGLAPRGASRLRPALVAVACLLVAALTQYVYPAHYDDLIVSTPMSHRVTAVLVARNLLLAGLAILLPAWTLVAMRGPRMPGSRVPGSQMAYGHTSSIHAPNQAEASSSTTPTTHA